MRPPPIRTAFLVSLSVLTALALLPAEPAITGPAVPPGEPTHEEQYMLEIIQRTRADPDAEAASFGIDLNEGLAPGTLSNAPREPFAFNFEVMKAARLHNDDLFANFDDLPPDHRGSDGKDPTGRVAATQAVFVGGVAENNAWTSKSGTKVDAAAIHAMHKLLFKDFTKNFEVVGRGHRKGLLTTTRNEVGIGIGGGNFGGRQATICTQDFITSNTTHIVGVVFDDVKVKDRFYTVGEAIGGVTITAKRQSDGAEFATTTWSAGGYNLPLEDGTYDVTASGAAIGQAVTQTGVVVAGKNRKVDFNPAGPPPPPPPTPVFTLTKATAKLSKKTGQWALAVKKATFNHGAHSFTRAELDGLEISVNGKEYFTPGTRAVDAVKEKVDKKTGEVTKLVIKQASGNKLTIDLKKKVLKIKLKDAPDFDPTGGTVSIELDLPTVTPRIEVAATITGKKLNKAVLAPGTGSFGL